jgi:hypothetical protein
VISLEAVKHHPMNLSRRTLLKSTLAATATAALGSRLSAATSSADREYYELRCYHLKAGTRLKADANPALLDAYLDKALLPALVQRGIKNVGAFTEIEINKDTTTSTPKAGAPLWLLIPHATLDSFVQVSAELNADAAMQEAGRAYLETKKSEPAYERFDTWLLLAFKSMPKMEVPAFSRNKTPTRVFEMRDYESHSEGRALNKMAMFDQGETELMRDLGMSPVFFGQALAGPNLPHLRYFTSGPDLATHLASWKKFGPDPRWTKLKNDPQYADNTSLNTARFLVPKPYSQI